MRLPSRFVITALRQTFSAGMLKAYTDSSNNIGEKLHSDSLPVFERKKITGGVGCT